MLHVLTRLMQFSSETVCSHNVKV